MKKWKVVLLIVASVLSVLAGCSNEHVTMWGLVGSDLDSSANQYTLRVGLCDGDEPGGVEVGLESRYVGTGGEQAYGAYGLLHLAGDQSTWLGQPYIGYHATVADSEDGGAYGPIVGTIYWDVFVVEVQPLQGYSGKLEKEFGESHDENVAYAGLRFEF